MSAPTQEIDDAGTGPAVDGIRPLGPDEIKSVVSREIADSLGGMGSDVSESQRQAIRYYYGRPMGNEIKDRSQVVMRDVLEVIEWTMPSLMRMFTSGTHIVRFHARDEKGQKNADLATAYINYLWQHRLNGFDILHDTFKTGLLEKNGFMKVYWEESRSPRVESYHGLTEDQMVELLNDPDVEPVASEERESELGQPLYDITVRRWKIEKGIKLDGIPPEEMLVARRMIRMDDNAPFLAQRKKVTASDLIAMGFDQDLIATVPSDQMPEFSMGRTERLSGDEGFDVAVSERRDGASREIWTTDCYIRIDEDGDGYAELRRILVVGENSGTVLEDVEISQHPFISMTPIPMPHKFYGQSLADLVMDLQVIRSTIMRQILDHIYLSNNPRLAIVEGMVEVEDLLTVRPGGLVRQRAPGQIEPLTLPPLPREAFQSLQYLEEVRANRTGIMAHGRELDASAINSTATGLAQLMAEKQQKIELIARIYANSLKELFRKMLRLIVENDSKEQQVRINGEWVTINPGEWDEAMDLEIEVGLGAGQAIERIANLEKVIAVQMQHIQNGGLDYTVTSKNMWESATRLVEACGYKNEELFFQNPDTQEEPEPPPNADIEELKLDAMKEKAEQAHKAALLQFDTTKEMNVVRHRQNQLEQEARKLQLSISAEENIVMHRQAELESQERTKIADIEMRERLGLGQQEASIESAQINADSKGEGEGEGESE